MSICVNFDKNKEIYIHSFIHFNVNSKQFTINSKKKGERSDKKKKRKES